MRLLHTHWRLLGLFLLAIFGLTYYLGSWNATVYGAGGVMVIGLGRALSLPLDKLVGSEAPPEYVHLQRSLRFLARTIERTRDFALVTAATLLISGLFARAVLGL